MRDFANPCSVLTKSPLLLRDIELFARAGRRGPSSPPTSRSRPSTRRPGGRPSRTRPHPRKRIEAVAELARNGIPTGVLIAPLMPGINDAPTQVEELLGLHRRGRRRERSAAIGLHLRGEVREIWFDWLRQYRPDLVPAYEKLYRRGAYLPREEARAALEAGRAVARGRGASRTSGHGRDDAAAGGNARGTEPPPAAAAEALLSESATLTVPSAQAAASRTPPSSRRAGAARPGQRAAEPHPEVEEGGEGAHRDAAALDRHPVDDQQRERREIAARNRRPSRSPRPAPPRGSAEAAIVSSPAHSIDPAPPRSGTGR